MTKTVAVYPAPRTRELKDTLLASPHVTGTAGSLPVTLGRSILRGRRRRRVAWLIVLLLTIVLSQAALFLRFHGRKPIVIYLPASTHERE